jgi:FkbM family methyltransferase
MLYRYSAADRARRIRGENAQLLRFLLVITRKVAQPVFVKVGANDGITGDPCSDLFLNHANWKGLLIEPVPYCVRKLRSIYGDRSRFIIDQVAVSTNPGSATFYYVSEDAQRSLSDLPYWYDQLGSFDRQHILRHLDGKLEPFILSADVKVEPLDSILHRHGLTRIDFLHIDTEGHDLEVINSVNLREHAPLAIFVEHKHLSTADRTKMKTLLKCNGYNFRTVGGDFLAVHREADKMMQRNCRSWPTQTATA